MTQHLRMFVADPDDPALTFLYPYGLVGDAFSSGLTIQTSSDQTELRAAISGKLSVNPVYYHGAGAGEPLEEETTTPRPQSITLYIHPDLAPSMDPEWTGREEAAGMGQLVEFAYTNVEVDSLLATWTGSMGAGRLDEATVPPGAIDDGRLLDKFLTGRVHLRVTAGDAIGKPVVMPGTGPPTRTFGFYVKTTAFGDSGSALPYAWLSPTGAVDPVAYYDEMRDFLADGSEMVDSLMSHVPKGWPILPNTYYSAPEAIQATAEHIYPWPALLSMARDHSLLDTQWAQVWSNQKALYRRHLLATVDPVRLDAQAQADAQDMPRFTFNDADAYNPIQLEALAEFYINFNDPYGPVSYVPNPNETHPPITRPLAPDDTGYQTADLGPGTGWHLVIIQAFGARKNLSGANAEAGGSTIDLLTPAEVTEDQNQSWPVLDSLMRVNPGFDTIYLDGDAARASGVYRITGVNAGTFTVTVDGTPDLGGQPSAWRIPAGVGGKLPPVDYNLGPGGSLGYDHHDGALFLVKDGRIYGVWRGSSYTSRSLFGYQYPLPSIRGNRAYYFRSHTSGSSQNINYAFRIKESKDHPEEDRSLPVRYYYYSNVEDGRSSGNLGHAIHRGYPGYSSIPNPSFGNGSMGCVPILEFFEFRRKMIEVYAGEGESGDLDPRLLELAGFNENQSQLAWCYEHPTEGDCDSVFLNAGITPSGPVTEYSKAWSNLAVDSPDQSPYTIEGTLWIIHPHEVPRHQSEY